MARYVGPIVFAFFALLSIFMLINYFVDASRKDVSILVVYIPILLLGLVISIRGIFGFAVIVTDEYVQIRGSFRWRKFSLSTVEKLFVGGPFIDTPQVDTDRLWVEFVDGSGKRGNRSP